MRGIATGSLEARHDDRAGWMSVPVSTLGTHEAPEIRFGHALIFVEILRHPCKVTGQRSNSSSTKKQKTSHAKSRGQTRIRMSCIVSRLYLDLCANERLVELRDVGALADMADASGCEREDTHA